MSHDELIERLVNVSCGLNNGGTKDQLKEIIQELETDPYEEPRQRPETDPKKQNNVEFITHLMDFGCPTGALIQPYVMAALEDYSSRVIAAKSPESDGGFISEEAWRRTAEHVKAQLEVRYEK